jgi:hypothetical protein
MAKTQMAVGEYVLLKPEPTPSPTSVISGLDQAASGRVVSIGDVGVDLGMGELVYFDSHLATQVGELLAVSPKDIFSVVADEEVVEAYALDIPVSSASQGDILAEVAEERAYQDTLWGQDNDDGATENEWKVYLSEYTHGYGRAEKYRDDFRTRMVKVAALAIAAVEAFDRTHVDLCPKQNAA